MANYSAISAENLVGIYAKKPFLLFFSGEG